MGAANARMPFGKHAGLLLSDIPNGYLAWIVNRDIREPLRRQIVIELRSRGIDPDQKDDSYRESQQPPRTESYQSGPSLRFTVGDASTVKALVEAGYKQLARQWHPDHGGELEKMQDLNQLIGRFRTQLEVLR